MYSLLKLTDNTKGIPLNVSSLSEIGNEMIQSDIVFGEFKNDYRSANNFIKTNIIALDIDNSKDPVLTIEAARIQFSRFKNIILPTRSHQIEKNGRVVDRFRVVLVLSDFIHTKDDFLTTWFWLKSQFSFIDESCKDPSRMWYKHQSIYAINEIGINCPIIRYQGLPEENQESFNILDQNERGDLSKNTYRSLFTGFDEGGRNSGVYLIARDFKQNGYSIEEAKSHIIQSLKRTETIDKRFSEYEAIMAIKSAYSKDAKYAPRVDEISNSSFSYISASDLLTTDDKPDDWLVPGLLLSGGVSILAGAPKTGKSTIARQLAIAIAGNGMFLNNEIKSGTVIHFSFDEKRRTSLAQYRKAGITSKMPIYMSFGITDSPNYLTDFENDIYKYAPKLVIIDTLFDMMKSEDTNNYAKIKRDIGKFNLIAEKTGAHIMFLHHTTKPSMNFGKYTGSNILGSTAIYGAVDTAIIFEKSKDKKRKLLVTGRAIDSKWEDNQLIFDYKTNTYYIDKEYDPNEF